MNRVTVVAACLKTTRRSTQLRTVGLETTERRLQYDEEAASLMSKQVQSQGPHLPEEEAASVAPETARAAVQSTFSALLRQTWLCGENAIGPPSCVRAAGDKVAKIRQECDCKVNEVLSQRDGLHVGLDFTDLQLLGAFSAW